VANIVLRMSSAANAVAARASARKIEQITVQAQSYASEMCPVDTGRLRSSITHEMGTEHGSPVGLVSANTNYAVFVHEGTGRMKGRPFLRQAAYKACRQAR
jgi:HK97 gp10 family phage protein